jgi:hypothetical protein
MSEGSAVAAKIFTWDWQEQPDMAAIAEVVHEVSGGRVHMREVDTGSDQYEWIVSDYPVDDAEAERLDEESTIYLADLQESATRGAGTC